MKKYILFKGVSMTAIIFTLMILVISITGQLYGGNAQKLSSFFRLGGNGVSNATILQILGLSLLIACLEAFFFHNKLFDNMMTLWKTVFLILSVLSAAVTFIIIFEWFPINFFKGWLLFALCFGGSCIASIIIMVIKTKMESEKYDRLLEEYRAKQSEQ